MITAIPDALPNHSQAEIDAVEAEQQRGVDDADLLDMGHNVLREPTFDELLITLGREAFTTMMAAEPGIPVSAGYDAEAADREFDRQDRIGRLNTGQTREVAGLAS